MEGIGSEVSQKIRAAIKAKLIELGAYVDDELPDYIMVMVANKRTKSQMDDDLQLFLSSNTKIFTTWLHTVLQKLQEVTVANFESKKDSVSKKSSKKKKSETGGESKTRRSSEEDGDKARKHSKKHKEGKKSKKAKHKSKDKDKSKYAKKEKEKGSTNNNNNNNNDDDEDEDDGDKKDEREASQNDRKIPEGNSKSQPLSLNEAVGKAILGNLKKNKRFKTDKTNSSSESSSLSDDSTSMEVKNQNDDKSIKQENNIKADDGSHKIKEIKSEGIAEETEGRKNQPVEDEFNIEPLKPSEKDSKLDLIDDGMVRSVASKESDVVVIEDEKTVSVPTEELLKEHNKLEREKLEAEEELENKGIPSDSEDSISPEEMRKQLLLSRAKKKLENSKLAERMRSNSPEVTCLDDTAKEVSSKNLSQSSRKPISNINNNNYSNSKISQKTNVYLSSRDSRFCDRSSQSSEDKKSCPAEKRSLQKKSIDNKQEEKINERRKPITLPKEDGDSSDRVVLRKNETGQRSGERGEEKRKNVIRISESLEMEKNMGLKKEIEKKGEKEVPLRKKPLSSRVVTITDPEGPEISSIVKVKPREFIAKDKQANKALILKAVADAEKSIARVQVRAEPSEAEPKKAALFTKNLRGKRYEKLAVTLSNIRQSPDARERLNRRISVDSDKSDKSRNKLDSSEMSEGLRGRSDLLSRKMSKSEDQFISSKTTVMEKNDRYIRCWLEGVEKAVKDDEMVNPNDIDDININSNLSIEGAENDEEDDDEEEFERKRKRTNVEETAVERGQKSKKVIEKDLEDVRVIPDSKCDSDDGPQIVVTLDGLDSKTIKDILSRNKRATNGSILGEGKEKASVTKSGGSEAPKKFGFEKISDRFGRLNKASEEIGSERVISGGGDRKASKRGKVESEKREINSTKSKNRELIAQLSEKFGKVDRKFEDRKRRYPEEDRRYLYDLRKGDRDNNGRSEKYKKPDKRSHKEGLSSSPPSKFTPLSSSGQTCKYSSNCKNLDCRYYHPKKCRFDEACSNPDYKYVHSESSSRRKSSWYSRS